MFESIQKLWNFLQVNSEGMFRYASSKWFTQALKTLVGSGVHGIAVDVWVTQFLLNKNMYRLYKNRIKLLKT